MALGTVKPDRLAFALLALQPGDEMGAEQKAEDERGWNESLKGARKFNI
jgi:hypothetical protein